MTSLHWLNGVIALLGSIAAFGAVNKMEWGKTKPCVIGAMVLIAVGLAGQWLGVLKSEWAQYSDTALYGGILALVLATQRLHTWCLERWANPFSSAIVLFAGMVFLVGLLGGCASAEPEEEIWQRVCYEEFLGRAQNGLVIVRHYCVREPAAAPQ